MPAQNLSAAAEGKLGRVTVSRQERSTFQLLQSPKVCSDRIRSKIQPPSFAAVRNRKECKITPGVGMFPGKTPFLSDHCSQDWDAEHIPKPLSGDESKSCPRAGTCLAFSSFPLTGVLLLL